MDIFELISNLGYPIVVNLFLLIRFEAKIDKLDSSIKELSEIIKSMK
ncbi:MAG: YvrJ family protein [Tissierellia bacterium]|nr:YvrJ family protein [Tissierellia bacterium]